MLINDIFKSQKEKRIKAIEIDIAKIESRIISNKKC